MAAREAILAGTRHRLFSDAASFCQRSECMEGPFPVKLDSDKYIAEMAHAISPW